MHPYQVYCYSRSVCVRERGKSSYAVCSCDFALDKKVPGALRANRKKKITKVALRNQIGILLIFHHDGANANINRVGNALVTAALRVGTTV